MTHSHVLQGISTVACPAPEYTNKKEVMFTCNNKADCRDYNIKANYLVIHHSDYGLYDRILHRCSDCVKYGLEVGLNYTVVATLGES